jgi:ABC-2 type transport system permease protein
MIQLILKDINFNKKNIYISTLVCLVGYYLISQDGERFKVLACTLIPLLMFNFIIGKLCFIEDRDKVFKYIQALPIKKSHFVTAKYLESLLVLVLSFAFIFAENYFLKILKRQFFNLEFEYTILIFSVMLIYVGIFIFLYFRFNYQVANQTLIVFYILCLMAYKLVELLNLDISKFMNSSYFHTLLLIFAFACYAITFRLSKFSYYRKEE